MERIFFKQLESLAIGETLVLSEVLEQLAFNEQGLIPVVTQDHASKEVLMLAWFNKESLTLTLSTKRMTYWSRSRKTLWIKGETSGHSQQLMSMSFDCDGDAVLCQVKQVGAACHTGRQHCFYLSVDTEQSKVYISEHAPTL